MVDSPSAWPPYPDQALLTLEEFRTVARERGVLVEIEKARGKTYVRIAGRRRVVTLTPNGHLTTYELYALCRFYDIPAPDCALEDPSD